MVSRLFFLCVFVIVADGESQMSVPEVVDPDSLMAYGNAARQDIIKGFVHKGTWGVLNGAWPVLKLKNDGKYKCGAVLISMHAALTSKDCVKGTNKLSVVVGNPNLNSTTNKEVTRNVSGTIEHPSRNLVIIKFNALPENNSAFKTVSIADPSLKDLSSLMQIRFYAFGRYQENITEPSNDLRFVRGKIVAACKCKATYKSHKPIDICTVLYYGRSFCAGDEGGAVFNIDWRARKYFLVGVISTVSNTCTPTEPGIATYVVDIQKWISQNTKNNV